MATRPSAPTGRGSTPRAHCGTRKSCQRAERPEPDVLFVCGTAEIGTAFCPTSPRSSTSASTATPCVAASKSAPTMTLASSPMTRAHARAQSERRQAGRSHRYRRDPASRPGGRRSAALGGLRRRDERLDGHHGRSAGPRLANRSSWTERPSLASTTPGPATFLRRRRPTSKRRASTSRTRNPEGARSLSSRQITVSVTWHASIQVCSTGGAPPLLRGAQRDGSRRRRVRNAGRIAFLPDTLEPLDSGLVAVRHRVPLTRRGAAKRGSCRLCALRAPAASE